MVRYYLPLIETIHVHGSSCSSHGSAEPETDSTHGSAPGPYSTLQGDFVTLRFAMNDESQLTVPAVFADPAESALSVIDARVVGGKCNKQSFHLTEVSDWCRLLFSLSDPARTGVGRRVSLLLAIRVTPLDAHHERESRGLP
jgi:hypothetical protein